MHVAFGRNKKHMYSKRSSHTNWTRNIYAADLYHNWRNWKGVPDTSQSTRRVNCQEEIKGEMYSKTMAWIRAKISFTILRSALLCLRGSWTIRKIRCNIVNIDLDVDVETNIGRINLF